MKRILFCMLAMIVMFGLNVPANAGQITIGTATYSGSDYNLIWDDDNNGKSVVWLDYTNSAATWTNQKNWALGLDSALTYNLNPGYAVTWNDDDWRLPTTVDGTYVYGTDGTTTGGYNITNSEMGHLFYTELGNKGFYDTSGTYVGDGNWGLNDTGDFLNLISSYYYWSGTEYSAYTSVAWNFGFDEGYQSTYYKINYNFYYGLAVRSGDVEAFDVEASDVAAVPEPTTIALLGIGLAGMGVYGVRRRRQRR